MSLSITQTGWTYFLCPVVRWHQHSRSHLGSALISLSNSVQTAVDYKRLRRPDISLFFPHYFSSFFPLSWGLLDQMLTDLLTLFALLWEEIRACVRESSWPMAIDDSVRSLCSVWGLTHTDRPHSLTTCQEPRQEHCTVPDVRSQPAITFECVFVFVGKCSLTIGLLFVQHFVLCIYCRWLIVLCLQTTFWVVREILHAQTLKIRAEVLSLYIRTAKVHTLYSTAYALQ